MKSGKFPLILIFIMLLSCSCEDDNGGTVIPDPNNPATYSFARDGESSVSFSGQTERANMLAAIKEYLLTGDAGEIIEASTLRQALMNTDDNGGGLFDFTSTKQLENKIFGPDLDEDYFGDIFEQAAISSKLQKEANVGEPGLIVRENKGTTILVNNKGQEFTQFIEKGLMGSVFLNQIYNVYLSDERTGDLVDNTTLVDGQNYTDLEHHWDEAFGYFTAPGDFGSNWNEARNEELRFWSNYANIIDPFTRINDRIMDAYRNGREAIVANDLDTKNQSRDILIRELEVLSVATAIHYINQSITNLNAGNTGELFHTLSEAYMFVRALNLIPNKKLPPSIWFNILNVDFGLEGNFWTVSADGLNTAKQNLVMSYPVLAPVQDEL